MRLQPGQRALVTGASQGIGRAMARLLAQRELDLVLLARSEERLRELARELGQDRTVLLACDLTQRIPAADELGRIDLLVNNAGCGVYGPLEEQAPERLLAMLDLNVRALVGLTRAVLPGMLERGAGGILNVGSNAGFQPLPYMAAYAASKAFVRSFSQALQVECRGRGVTVTAFCPGFTRTDFHTLCGNPVAPPLLSQSAETVARTGLRALEAGRSTVVSGWYNAALAGLTHLAPGPVAARVAGRVLHP